MNIPDDVLKDAARTLFSARFGAVPEDIEGDKDFEWAVEDLATAAPVIAVWARKEALREAAEAVRENAGDEDENGICEGVSNWPRPSAGTYSFAAHEAIEAIRALAEGDTE